MGTRINSRFEITKYSWGTYMVVDIKGLILSVQHIEIVREYANFLKNSPRDVCITLVVVI